MNSPDTDAFGHPTSPTNVSAPSPHVADSRLPEGTVDRSSRGRRWPPLAVRLRLGRTVVLLVLLVALLGRTQAGSGSFLIVLLVVLFASRLLFMFSMSDMANE